MNNISWNNINWVAVSSVAASISALLSLVGIILNAIYNKKNYRANLEINSKLNLLKSVRKLVPDYIAAVNYTLYLFGKGWADENDKQAKKRGRLSPGVIIGETGLEAYDAQLTKAKIVYEELKVTLKIYESQNLLDDVENVWNILSKENRDNISLNASNKRISKEEEKINKSFNEASNKLTEAFAEWYDNEFKRLTK